MRFLTHKKVFHDQLCLPVPKPHPLRPAPCISQAALSQGGFSSSGSFLGAGNAAKVTISAHAWTQEGWESLGWERHLAGVCFRDTFSLRQNVHIRQECLLANA